MEVVQTASLFTEHLISVPAFMGRPVSFLHQLTHDPE